MSRRRLSLLLVLLFACVAALGGWVLVAPAMPKAGAMVAEAPADLDGLPAATAPHAGGVATSDANGASASSVALRPAASASDAAAPDARCGDDQLPVSRSPDPDPVDGGIHPEMPVPDPDGVLRRYPGEIKAAGPGFTGAMARLDAALRASVDPFDRAMADWLDLNLLTPPPVRQEALARDALAVSDARVYRLAYVACNSWTAVLIPGRPAAPAPAPTCAQLSTEAWARLDPGNAEPWLYALAQAEESGDTAAQHAALDRLAESTRLDIRFHAGAAAVSRQRLRDADLAAQVMAAEKAIGMEWPPFHPLTNRCRGLAGGDPALAATCDRIAATFYDHSDTYIGRAIGGSAHKLATGDPTWLDRAHQEQRERKPTPFEPAPGTAPCGAQRALLAYFVRMDQTGELPAATRASLAASR